jgi:hypothetical protein
VGSRFINPILVRSHAIVGLLLSGVHAYIYWSLEVRKNSGDEYHLGSPTVFDNIDIRSAAFQHQVWLATGGAMLVLVQSILSGTRRVWWRLLLSCAIGGIGSTLAGYIFHDSKWVYAICGVAAIMSENIIFGLFRVSEEFKEAPIDVFSKLWRLIMPTFRGGESAPATDVGMEQPHRGRDCHEQPVG